MWPFGPLVFSRVDISGWITYYKSTISKFNVANNFLLILCARFI